MLNVGDEVVFVLTLSSGAESGAEARISATTFNGETLTWTTANDIDFTATYTVAETNSELTSIQLEDVSLTDAAGNESAALSSNTISKGIDSDTPVITGVVASTGVAGSSLVVGDQVTFEITLNQADEGISILDLREMLRMKGIKDTGQIEYAFLETSGNLSVIMNHKTDEVHSTIDDLLQQIKE